MEMTACTHITGAQMRVLGDVFGDRLQRDVTLARYTAARIGGPADGLLVVNSVDDLADTARKLWDLEIPFFLMGGGSNILVSDQGFRGVVVLNRAKQIEIDAHAPSVWAGSGASFGQMARMVSKRGLGGLEWATGIPGTVGGAVFGNAGAHGGDVAGDLIVAEILHRDGRRAHWGPEKLGYHYRSSALKRDSIPAIILSAKFGVDPSTPAETQQLVAKFADRRQRTQPPGASMGSMFVNPPGDYAGRLIEAAGLKGTRIGNAEISLVHANFFINHGDTKAGDIYALIQLARETVLEKFGVDLRCEIELIGSFNL